MKMISNTGRAGSYHKAGANLSPAPPKAISSKAVLLGATAFIAFAAEPAAAQFVIEGGATETVDPVNGGTQTDPWNVGGDLTVGRTGGGVLNILEGGSVTADNALFSGVGTSGFINVSDSSSLTITNDLRMNGLSDRISVSNGSTLTSAFASIGGAAGSQARVNVSALNSEWNNSGELRIGESGVGDVSIFNTGRLNTNTTILGYNASGEGEISLNGNVNWQNTGNLIVGREGTGALTLELSQARMTNGGNFIIGQLAGSSGTAIIQNGAQMSTDSLIIANDSGSSGELIIRGEDSLLDVNTDFNIINGAARLAIESGGRINVTGDSYLGQSTGDTAEIIVDGAGSTLEGQGFIDIGNSGNANATVSNGGSILADDFYIGFDSNSTGVATVDGENSILEAASNIYLGNSGSGTLILSNGGLVRSVASNTLELGIDAGSTGRVVIGSLPGEETTGAGVVGTETVSLEVGEASVIFNHSDTDYVFAANVTSDRGNSGSTAIHEVEVYSGVTTMTGVWDHDGATEIFGGRLNVDGTLAGRVAVVDGALGGTGTIGEVEVGFGSVLAPGGSIGTMTVTGDIVFNDGSLFEVEVTEGGASDLVNAGGAVSIGNDVVLVVLPENGTDDGRTYNENTRYTFLTAAGGITGEFASITEEFAFLAAEVTIENGEAVLTLTRDAAPFEEVAISRNQRSIARSLDALGSGSELFNTVIGLSETQARDAFDQLSGEIHASALASVMQDSRLVRETATDRLRSASGDQGFSIWGSAYGSWGTWDQNDNTAAELDRSTAGFVFGADFPLFNALRVGAMLGVASGDIEVESRGSEADLNSFHFGAYADWDLFKAFTLRAGLVNSWNDLETERAVDIRGFNSYSDRLTAEYNANVFQLFAEAAYAFDLGRFNLEPYAGLAYASLDADEVTESGGSARLASGEYDMETTFSTLGMRADYGFELFGAGAVLEGGLAWRHAFDDTLPRQTFNFAGADLAFTTEGVPLAEDAAVIDLGVSLPLAKRLGAKLGYNGEFGDGVSDHGVRANLNFAF